MRILKVKAKMLGLAATTLLCAGSLSACQNEQATVYGPPSDFDMEAAVPSMEAAVPSITSKWVIESWSIDSETSYPLSIDDESQLPSFNSDDGKTFFLTVTGAKEYRGDLIPQEDGSYQLKYGDNPNVLTAVIEGDRLTITLPTGTYMTFVAEQ